MYPFEHTESIALELSNSCSHAWLHDKCPLHQCMAEPGLIAEPKTLPLHIALSVLETLAEHRYRGEIAFHQYNEPLQDPRLFKLLESACRIDNAKPYIVTNGYNLTPMLTGELISYGVKRIVISIFGSGNARKTMLKRAELLQHAFGDVIETNPNHVMDDRLLVYDVPKPDPHQPCYAPLREVVVTCEGKVGLCCFDWKRKVTFGDLREQTLEQILTSHDVVKKYNELSAGYRVLPICRQCGRSR